jgi:membrane-associated phospholipid phosphatase
MWGNRVRRFLAGRLTSETFLGLDLTVSLLAVGGGVWLFSALWDAVLDNATLVRFDRAADAWIHARVTSSGLAVFQLISELGSPTSMAVLCVVVALLLLWHRRIPMLITWIAAFAGSGILGRIVKAAAHRGRPTFGIIYLTDASYSFPSGHSAATFIGVAMTLFVLKTRGVVGTKWLVVLGTIGATFVILVGVSRVYLGVHYPSDVIGGFAVSAAWGGICVGIAGLVMHRRGRSL